MLCTLYSKSELQYFDSSGFLSYIRAMRRLITHLVLVCGIPFSGVHAANADVMGEWLSQQGLVQHAQSGRVKVQAMASELAA